MKLNATLEIINILANTKGHKSSNKPCFSQLSLGKDQNSNRYYLIVTNTKKPNADKFKAEVNQLKAFLKLVNLASNSDSIKEEDLNSAGTNSSAKNTTSNQPLRKPITSLTIKSKNEYNTNFKAVITQNLKIKSTLAKCEIPYLNLTKLTINNCELIQINSSIFELEQLNYLNLSNNKLTKLENFAFESIEELIFSNNEIELIGANIRAPKLTSLDLSNNQLTKIDEFFCKNFNRLHKLNLNKNNIASVHHSFGFSLFNLKVFSACNNKLNTLPYSLSYLRLEALELQDNPYKYIGLIEKLTVNLKFPKLVEVSARAVVDKKVKYLPHEIPKTLDEYVKKSLKCICGRSCFESTFKLVSMTNMSKISKEFTCQTINGFDNHVPLLIHLCSWRCYTKNFKLLKYQFQND